MVARMRERATLPGRARARAVALAEAAGAVAGARRFTGAARRVEIDEATGVHNHRGYEVALEREVARAVRTQRPLALVLLALQDLADAPRRTDWHTSSRRSSAAEQEYGHGVSPEPRGARRLLPQTSGEGAQRFHGRLASELESSTFTESDALTVSTDIFEWKPHETSHSFDARARAALEDRGIRALPRRPHGGEPAGEDTLDAR